MYNVCPTFVELEQNSMVHESLVSDEIFVRHTSHTQSESWCKPKYVVKISPSLPRK